MLAVRVIPVLLLRGSGLVKSVNFKAFTYVGDPINAVRIFNEKEVDELVLLDITATAEHRRPNLPAIEAIVSEAFMPVAYGGGVHTLEDARNILRVGVEKICFNTAAVRDPALVRRAADAFGSQSVVLSVDVKRKALGRYGVFTESGHRSTGFEAAEFVARMQEAGVGEVLLNSIDRDGTMGGYDLDLIRRVAAVASVPLVVCGGAGSLDHLAEAVRAGASAVAAGSMFVFHGRHRAVLISYPDRGDLEAALTFVGPDSRS